MTTITPATIAELREAIELDANREPITGFKYHSTTIGMVMNRITEILDALEAERARVAVLEEAIEVYALPLLWALKMDGKLSDGTTAENHLRSVVKPKATLEHPTEGKRDE